MKTPTLIGAIERDLAAGHAAVVQLVSTGEALMERRLAEIPTEEWGDVRSTSRRANTCSTICHAFPTQLYEPYTDAEGNLLSRPVYRDGQPVQWREAVERRDRLIEHLAALPPVPGALDQIVQHFGTDRSPKSPAARAASCARVGRSTARRRKPSRLGQPRRDRSLHGR